MEPIAMIVGTASGAVAGYCIGLMRKDRDMDQECETAYLAGHVDGHAKAEHDHIVLDWKADR